MQDAAAAVNALTGLMPTAGTLTVAVLFYLAGAATPTYYAQERLRGFGRVLADRIPYKPPPGMNEEQALSAAIESAEEEQADKQQQAVTE